MINTPLGTKYTTPNTKYATSNTNYISPKYTIPNTKYIPPNTKCTHLLLFFEHFESGDKYHISKLSQIYFPYWKKTISFFVGCQDALLLKPLLPLHRPRHCNPQSAVFHNCKHFFPPQRVWYEPPPAENYRLIFFNPLSSFKMTQQKISSHSIQSTLWILWKAWT